MRIDSAGKIQIGNNIPMWSGSFGGAVFLKGNNATADRNVRLAIVDSTGAQDGDKELILDNNGDVTVKGGDLIFGTAGKGIVLGATTNVAANTLDDYEEGDYNCTVTCSTSGTATLNTSYDRAGYTKVGRLVTVHGFIVVDSVSSPVGYFKVSLPFTAANLTERAGDAAASVTMNNVASANCADFVASVNEGAAYLYVQLGDANALQNDSAQQLQANTYIAFSTTYATA
jgi:hypothetical protein